MGTKRKGDYMVALESYFENLQRSNVAVAFGNLVQKKFEGGQNRPLPVIFSRVAAGKLQWAAAFSILVVPL